MNDSKQGPEERLVALLYGELSAEEERELRARLAEDPTLRAQWEELLSARSLLEKWDLQESAPRLVFVQRIRRRRGELSPRPGTRPSDRLRRLLAAPAWAMAAAALLVAILALAQFRIDRTGQGLAFRFGGAPVQTPSEYLTRTEFDAYTQSMGEAVLGALNDYTQQRDRDVSLFMQTALSGLNTQQARAYRELRTRIDGLGIGLMEDQTQTRERVDYLWNQRLRSVPASNGIAPGTQPEGDRNEQH